MQTEPLIQELKKEQQELYEEALEIAQEFWSEHFAHRKNAKTLEDRGLFGVRVRKRAAGVSVFWFKSQFVKRGGRTRKLDDFISKGKGYKYPPNKFAGMSEWEREKALEVEEQMQNIRKRSERLTTIMKMIKAYKKFKDETSVYTGDDE